MDVRIRKDVDASGVDRSVPADCMLATQNGQLPGADLRLYQFHSDRTKVPPLRDVVLIAWQSRAEIALRCGAIHSQGQMSPWDFSILRPGFESIWHWNTSFRAMVLYLSEKRLASIASEVFDQHVDRIEVRECFQLQDPAIQHAVASLATELRGERLGGSLYSETLLTQTCIHLLRHHADAKLREPRCPGALSAAQARHVAEFIETHLASDLSLESLSRVAGISQYHFARMFRKRFDMPPHAYVQRRRVERARHLLTHSDMALKEIVCATGFYDQSHLTKSFKRAFDATPSALRRSRAPH
jgi:AraC family transcriptional regulator